MARHKMPQRTKRRLIAAGIAAVTVIGTGVVIGVTGNAFARGGRGSQQPDLSVLECIADPADPTSSAAPPPATTSSTTSESAPAEQPPAEQPPAEAPTETETSSSEAPATETSSSEAPAGYTAQDRLVRLGGAPPTETPGKPAPPPDNSGAAGAANEAGPPNPATPEPQPQAELQTFAKPSCTDALGPFPQDFVDIRKVRPASLDARPQRGASRGTFTTRCGTNAGRPHSNSDNVIVAPGVVNGAHHTHDYVGNQDTSQASTNDSLLAAGTTCQNQQDKSTYYWPVIRVRNRDGGGTPGEIAENPHNIGDIITPVSAAIQFRGSPTGKVVAMPQFLRIITGDAKASINGGANANVKWTCTGFTNRFTTKYPLCPRGSRVQIISDFQSCWDGANIDSANHRTHVVFPDRAGACPAGTQAIPQLRITLTYDVPRGRIFAVDAFPEVQHNPLTHHNDFINVMSEQLMQRAVDCINSGRNC